MSKAKIVGGAYIWEILNEFVYRTMLLLRQTLTFVLCVLAYGRRGAVAHREVQVRLDEATVVGTENDGVESFLGIPYAHPP